MKRVFCTIITEDFLPYARTLFKSIKKFDEHVDCIALVVNSSKNLDAEEFGVIYSKDLIEADLVHENESKYFNDFDSLRWTFKSILMIHLLKTEIYEQVFFVDPDICFYSKFDFLYSNLGESSLLLSPHWSCMDPSKSEVYFYRSLTNGLYNAGFIGATIKGISTLYAWAKMCLFACKRDTDKGFFVDQGYLNLFPILDPETKIKTHRGCNVAEWNRFENIRSLSSEGELILNGRFPLVFIHFSNLGYLYENDPFLIPYLKEYDMELRKNGFSGDLISKTKDFVNRQRLKKLSMLDRIIRKVIGHYSFSKYKKWLS